MLKTSLSSETVGDGPVLGESGIASGVQRGDAGGATGLPRLPRLLAVSVGVAKGSYSGLDAV